MEDKKIPEVEQCDWLNGEDSEGDVQGEIDIPSPKSTSSNELLNVDPLVDKISPNGNNSNETIEKLLSNEELAQVNIENNEIKNRIFEIEFGDLSGEDEDEKREENTVDEENSEKKKLDIEERLRLEELKAQEEAEYMNVGITAGNGRINNTTQTMIKLLTPQLLKSLINYSGQMEMIYESGGTEDYYLFNRYMAKSFMKFCTMASI